MRHRISIIALSLTTLFLGVTTSLRAEVHFREVSFDQAKQLAAQEHKAVMIDFYTTWCGWCKTLDRNTYTDDNVTKLTDAKFIAVKIDAEKGEGVALAKQYKVTGYPTIIFFDEGGKEVDRVVGYEDAARFARSLETAAAGGSKAVLSEVESAHPTKDATKWLVAANYYAQQNWRDKSLAAFRKVLELDPKNKKGGNAEAMYGVGFLSSGDSQWTVLSSALEKFPDESDADQANMLLLRHEFEINDTAQAGHRIDQWAMSHPRDVESFNFFAWTAAQHGTLLMAADDYAKRAVSLSQSAQEKASTMDTRAMVLMKSGNISEASKVEGDALALLDPVKDKKLYNELTSEKAKIDKAMAEGPSSSQANH